MLTIAEEHMRNRCFFMSALCCVSMYNWYNYSLFDPISNDIYTPYYQNSLFMLFYIGWDTYHMILGPNKDILFRTDLAIHHVLCLVIISSYINHTPLQMSNYTIMECISLMNYIWRNNPRLLNIYRTICIVLIRIPLMSWYIIYYTPQIGLPILRYKLPSCHYYYLYGLSSFQCFFIVYDIFILSKIYKQMKKR
jgi:hypothetical protein